MKTELAEELWYGDVPAPENWKEYRWGMTCCAKDCEAHCLVVRPDNKLITDVRAIELILLNGWSHLGIGRYACPLHTIMAGQD